MSTQNNHTHQFSYALNQTAPVDISFANPNYLEQSLSQDQPIQINLKSQQYSKVDFQPQMKNTEELVLVKAESEKKTIMKAKLKQQRLYKKIQQTQQPINGAGQNFDGTTTQNKRKKMSYVQALLEKSKQFLAQNEDQEEFLRSACKIMQKNQDQKILKKRKTLTVAPSFKLRTMKRVRLDIDEEKSINKEEYVPLCSQQKHNFRLRESDPKSQNERSKIRDLTKPQSPNLQTLERMKLKGEFHIASGYKTQDCQHHSDFKAKPFNKMAFENPFVPKIEKKSVITFEKFNLSKSNTKIAKKTLDDYINNKENASQNIFRAKSHDKKLFEKKDISPISEVKPQKLTEISPFNFKTEEHLGNRQISENSSCQDQNTKQEICQNINSLKSSMILKRKLLSKNLSQLLNKDSQRKQVEVLMRKNKTNNLMNIMLCQCQIFRTQNLRLAQRDKLPKLQSQSLSNFFLMLEEEKIKLNLRAQLSKSANSLKSNQDLKQESSESSTPLIINMDFLIQAVCIIQAQPNAVTAKKDIRLHTMARSQSRDDYKRKMRQKEHEMQVREISITKQKMKEMGDEIKKIRDQQVIKASGIRKYQALDGSKVPEKPLIIPQMPKLSTFKNYDILLIQ